MRSTGTTTSISSSSFVSASMTVRNALRAAQTSFFRPSVQTTSVSYAPRCSASAPRRSIFAVSSASLSPTRVTRMYAPASLPSTTVGKMVLPVNAAEESTMSRSMNSIDCGSRLASLICGTEAMAVSTSANGRMRLTFISGLGMSLSVSSVMTPSVPSEPIIRCSRL